MVHWGPRAPTPALYWSHSLSLFKRKEKKSRRPPGQVCDESKQTKTCDSAPRRPRRRVDAPAPPPPPQAPSAAAPARSRTWVVSAAPCPGKSLSPEEQTGFCPTNGEQRWPFLGGRGGNSGPQGPSTLADSSFVHSVLPASSAGRGPRFLQQKSVSITAPRPALGCPL